MPEQQDRLYAAERCVDGGSVFADVATVASWLSQLRDTWWWSQWTPNVLYVEADEVKAGTHGRSAAGCAAYLGGGVGRMELHRGTRLTEQLIIHELSHIIAGARCNSHSHDPWFARVYAELTFLIRGTAIWQQLKQAFDAHGIDYDAEGLAPR
jgi:hypothetical protein